MSDNDTKTGFTARVKNPDWANINTKIKHEGKEIILPALPAEMSYKAAIETIKRIDEQESQKFDTNELIEGAPWDALTATYKAMQDIYGVVTSHSIKTWFGDIKPEFITVNTGPAPTDKIQVPIKQMRIPGFNEPVFLALDMHGARIYGTVNKKDQTRLVEIANRAREIIRSDSIYRAKAIRLSVDEEGDIMLDKQPEFLDLATVSESDMIHTEETETLIRTNIFSPLKNTAGARKHKIPLKRGILLEGRYGTGKSLTARVTAKVAIDNGWTFIILDRAQGLGSAIEFARSLQPCVIFAEDIDRAADREDEDVNDLVNLIDGVISKDMEMMVVLTTNFIDKIDQALLRPGRFDAVISIQVPDAETAIRLVKQYARELLPESAELDKVGELAAGQIPAVIREIVERAKLSMLYENRQGLTPEDLFASALGMKRHMELLEPKNKVKSPQDMFFEGLQAMLGSASGGSDGTASIPVIVGEGNKTRSLIGRVAEKLDARGQSAEAAAQGALSKSQETLVQVKALGAKK